MYQLSFRDEVWNYKHDNIMLNICIKMYNKYIYYLIINLIIAGVSEERKPRKLPTHVIAWNK